MQGKEAEGTGLEQPAKPLGFDHILGEAAHKAAQSATLPKDKAVRNAIESLNQSRLAVQRLIDGIGRDEHYQLSLLGPILANLKDAQATLESLQ